MNQSKFHVKTAFFCCFSLLILLSISGCGGGTGTGTDTDAGGTTGGGTTGGDTTGGGFTGGGEIAFVSGHVSYPSSGLTKPEVMPDGSKKYKISVTKSGLINIQQAYIDAFKIEDDGTETKIATVISDDSGIYSFTETQLAGYTNDLLVLKARFTSPVSQQDVAIRQLLNLADPDTAKTGVTVNPLTEAIL